MLNGLTMDPNDKLLSLAKSWSNPPDLRIAKPGNFKNHGYDPSERAYKITCLDEDGPEELEIEINATIDSPVVNLCLIIENWGKSEPRVKMNGNPLLEGKQFHFGHRLSLVGNDLLVWIEKETVNRVILTISKD
jgi:hypothetical protein